MNHLRLELCPLRETLATWSGIVSATIDGEQVAEAIAEKNKINR